MSKFFSQKPIILASASRSRQILLESLGLKFDVIPSNCDETSLKENMKHLSQVEMAEYLAVEKALSISRLYPDKVVIGADQLCVLNDRIFDKPGSHETAILHLRELSGKTHQQISACCLAQHGEISWQGSDIAYLTLHHLTDTTIERYLRAEQPYQSCGAYHFEGHAKWLFSNVLGSESTIQGLPLILLVNALQQIGAVSINF